MACSRSRPWMPLVAILILITAAPAPLPAQYFGQNKVRYEDFDFKVLKTEHFDIYYYDEAAAATKELGRMSERWYERLSRVLDHRLSSRQPIIVYASHPAFRGTSVIPDELGETTGGVTEGLRRRMILPFAGPMKETDHVLGHEMVHAFQYDITRRGDIPGAAQLPLWFIEGMAEYLTIGPEDSQTAMWMRDAVRRDKLPDIDHLDRPEYFPYRYGHAFWAYVGGRYGDEVIGRMLENASDNSDPNEAIRRVLSIDPKALSQEWHAALRQEYEPTLRAVSSSGEGSSVIEASKSGGQINVGTSLSPDGSQMVFFSEHDLFSIDLYLADARTGRTLDKITHTARDPHIDSLQFVNSAGAWTRDGRQFAFGSISAGRPELSIYSIPDRRVTRKIALPRLGEIYHLTWSPDAQSIAFSGVSGGVTDLFILDMETESIRQLTNDMFADLQPAWAPDGTRIAFVTDRFGSSLQELAFGAYRLALINPVTAQIERVQGFNRGSETNPQWSGDSASVFFISDPDGIANIYRVQRNNGSLHQVTSTATGITGITRLSPAISVASNSPAIVFSSFSEGMYSLRRLDGTTGLAGRPVTQISLVERPPILPPRSRTAGEVASLLGNPGQGLQSAQTFTTEDYRSRLSLDYIAQPTVEVGVSNFGSLIGGGTTIAWSDLLGRHNLATTVQTSFSSNGGKFLNNLAGIAEYRNESRRWTWGLTGGQVPYVSGEFSRELSSDENGLLVVDRSNLFWQINREVLGYVAYPFNRAQRLEFSTGYRHVSFDAQQTIEVFDPTTGQLLGDRTDDIDSPASLNFGTAATALVYDTSVFGGTSPVLGRRYRFEAGGTAGSLRYGTLLGDFRQYYQIARPLSVAGRVLHFGRYGRNAEDTRLQDLFIGSNSLVRGYGVGSFSASECGPVTETANDCPIFDRLVGSRMAVANAEVRMPLLGALGVVRSPQIPPVETALFFDAGVAWTSRDKANFLGGSRRPVTSYGASLRVNLLGFAIGQVSFVHPNDRPMKDWVWEFSLAPGF